MSDEKREGKVCEPSEQDVESFAGVARACAALVAMTAPREQQVSAAHVVGAALARATSEVLEGKVASDGHEQCIEALIAAVSAHIVADVRHESEIAQVKASVTQPEGKA